MPTIDERIQFAEQYGAKAIAVSIDDWRALKERAETAEARAGLAEAALSEMEARYFGPQSDVIARLQARVTTAEAELDVLRTRSARYPHQEVFTTDVGTLGVRNRNPRVRR